MHNIILNMAIKLDTFSSTAFDLLIKELEPLLDSPVEFERFTDPKITPCGHSFEQRELERIIQHDSLCPIDRKKIVPKDLRPDLFIRTISNLKLTKVVLETPLSIKHKCPIDFKPLFEAVKLPCGHSYNFSALAQWYQTVQVCPEDAIEFDINDVAYDTESIKLAKNEYGDYVKKAQKQNLELDSKVSKDNLDDRPELLKMFYCPISKEIIKDPVTGICGHTFDKKSIGKKSRCPIDKSKITAQNVSENFLARKILEVFKKYSDFREIPPDDSEPKVILFVDSNTMIKKVSQIIHSIGFTFSEDEKSESLSISKIKPSEDNAVHLSGFFRELDAQHVEEIARSEDKGIGEEEEGKGCGLHGKLEELRTKAALEEDRSSTQENI